MDTDHPLQEQALEHVRELLATHWREARDSADEDGKFAIGLRISVFNGAPARLKVKCSISKTITDEPERSGDSQQMLSTGRGEAEANRKPGGRSGSDGAAVGWPIGRFDSWRVRLFNEIW